MAEIERENEADTGVWGEGGGAKELPEDVVEKQKSQFASACWVRL